MHTNEPQLRAAPCPVTLLPTPGTGCRASHPSTERPSTEISFGFAVGAAAAPRQSQPQPLESLVRVPAAPPERPPRLGRPARCRPSLPAKRDPAWRSSACPEAGVRDPHKGRPGSSAGSAATAKAPTRCRASGPSLCSSLAPLTSRRSRGSLGPPGPARPGPPGAAAAAALRPRRCPRFRTRPEVGARCLPREEP